MTARPTKCCIGFKQLQCLGHTVGEDSLKTHPDKIKAVEEAPSPMTKRQVRSCLGLVGFYRKYMHNFVQIAAALMDATCKGQPNMVIKGDSKENA